MLWLERPPYLRWAIAAAVLLGAVVLEFSGTATVERPFAASPVAAGDRLSDQNVRFRIVPEGMLPSVDMEGAVAAVAIEAGEPIVPSMLRTESLVPAGWWAVPVMLPSTATVGTVVRLIVTDQPASTEGIVIERGGDDPYSPADAGLVAVPPDGAEAVARAAAAGALTLLVAP